MRLNSISVRGFRSLADVSGIPVGSPTILTGPNDGGKTAVLDALDFLVGGGFRPASEDRSYLPGDSGSADRSVTGARCGSIEVQGEFSLDPWEQHTFGLPEKVAIRRVADDEGRRLERFGPLPDDERLRDLDSLLLKDLKPLAKDLGLIARGPLKGDFLDVLRRHADENSSDEGWSGVPSAVEKRMPRLLRFGSAGNPDTSIKGVLKSRFQIHVDDESVRERLEVLQREVETQLSEDAKSLSAHIHTRCPDLHSVEVIPTVSFAPSFEKAALSFARHPGERVGLERSGLGTRQRISLATWEWTSELLASDAAEQVTEDPDGPEVRQTIVVYDEPDTHLDYAQQRKIMELIRSQGEIPSTNVIVATHSMNLIDGVDISDVINLRLVRNRTEVERLGSGEHGDIDRHLGRIAASLGFRNTVLLNERLFVAVEGDSEMAAFPILFAVSQRKSLQAAGIAMWPCEGNDGALRFAKYLIDRERKVALVIDADSRSKKLFREDRLARELGAGWERFVKFVGEGGADELEGLFTDAQWAEVANDVSPRKEPWTPGDIKALRAEPKFGKTLERELGVGKRQLMYRMAGLVRDRNEIPRQLNEIFDGLDALAN